eukprot:UN16502
MPQAFKNGIPRYEWSFSLVIKVHANKVPIKINKGASNPNLLILHVEVKSSVQSNLLGSSVNIPHAAVNAPPTKA